MKRILYFFIAAAVSASLLSACNNNKKDTVDNYTTEQSDIMKKMQEDMEKVQDTGNATLDFLYGMIPHHESAIEMSKSYLKYAKNKENPRFKDMAEDIIETQEEEIKEMQKMAKSIEENKVIDYEDEQSYLKEYHAMMKGHDMSHNMVTSDLDTAFAEGMIMHHQMAVDMAESILKYTNNEDVIELAKDIIDTQEEEISEMQSFLDENADNKSHNQH